jgi:hypothetical protein
MAARGTVKKYVTLALLIMITNGMVGSDGVHANGSDTHIDRLARLLLRVEDRTTLANVEQELVSAVRRDVLSSSALHSENRVLVGQLTNRRSPAIVVAISFSPYEGNIVILGENGGHYEPIGQLRRTGFVETLETIKLFPIATEQLIVKMAGGGSGWRHSALDIYAWDGTNLRMIWEGVREDLYRGEPVDDDMDTGRQVVNRISFHDKDGDGIAEIYESMTIGEVLLSRDWRIIRSMRHTTLERVHRWSEDLFHYVTALGRIRKAQTGIKCWQGVKGEAHYENVARGQVIGLLTSGPAFEAAGAGYYHAVLRKERFCLIPKDAVERIEER